VRRVVQPVVRHPVPHAVEKDGGAVGPDPAAEVVSAR
jgi:hypothetical protein